MTQAVIREFATRTRFRVTPDAGADADAVLHGTILKQTATPLTYNAATQQSSSFLITIVASVTLTARDGRVLYENKNYVFREQYQSTTNLPTFIQEDPAAVQRLSREFAASLWPTCWKGSEVSHVARSEDVRSSGHRRFALRGLDFRAGFAGSLRHGILEPHDDRSSCSARTRRRERVSGARWGAGFAAVGPLCGGD